MARIAYVDCSPMMAATLARMAAPAGLRVFEGDPDPAQLRATIADAGVVLNGHTAMDAALLEGLPRLRSIVFLGTGASSYVDLDAAARLGMRVRTIRGYGDRSVAEHAFALLLAAARGIAGMDRGLRAGAWTQAEGFELAGRTLGLLGLGGVGGEMARIASGFGMRVVGWSRSGVPAGLPVEAMALDDVLAASDVVSLHLALVEQTRGLLDAARIARMKRGAILVNTARGALGASQNRLTSAYTSIQSARENLSAAESRIRDVDVAYETADLTRNSILQQAAVSVLSQANVQPQLALRLLG